MIGVVAFHVLMLALGLAVASRTISAQRVSDTLGYVHKSIGITMPTTKQARMVALIWIGSIIVIVDGCISLLVFIAKMSNAR